MKPCFVSEAAHWWSLGRALISSSPLADGEALPMLGQAVARIWDQALA